MRYLMRIAVVLLCGAAFLAGCSKKTPPMESREASEDRQVPQNAQPSENPPSSPSTSTSPAASTSPSAPAEVMALNEANFDSQIRQGVVLVDFWATWCGPCRIQGPIVEQVAKQIGGAAKIAKLDVDAATTIAQRFNIDSIPTLIVFKDGKPVQQFVGITEAETLVSAIQGALKS